MTPEEEKELRDLKHIRCERGFFCPVEEKRFNELFDKLAKRVLPRLRTEEETARLEDLN